MFVRYYLTKTFLKRMAAVMVTVMLGLPVSAQEEWWAQTPTDSTYGIGLREVTSVVRDYGLKARKPITVAVIDGGMDTEHPLIAPRLWTNKREKADGKDNDRNGLIDDRHGWNWLSGAAGEPIMRTGTEEYRQWKRLYLKQQSEGRLNEEDSVLFATMERKVHMQSYLFYARNLEAIWNRLQVADSLMQIWGGGRQLLVKDLKSLEVEDTTGVMEALGVAAMQALQVDPQLPWNDFIAKQRHQTELAMKRISTLENDDDAHRKVGNNPLDFSNYSYGSSVLNVGNEDAYHATMVGGLVLQVAEMTGADERLMVLRAVPDGDEYDRDIVAAIRYAVEQGARVVNMSFGKTYSPNRHEVDEALDFAAQHDVLLVVAAGNFGKDKDLIQYYPDEIAVDGKRRRNILSVGSADEKGRRASFSNYGVAHVDVLAPGTQLRSYAPGGGWGVSQGTSLSAPIVSGLAAALRAYFPKLRAEEVREIICQSARSDVHSGVRAGLVDAAEAFRRAALWRK